MLFRCFVICSLLLVPVCSWSAANVEQGLTVWRHDPAGAIDRWLPLAREGDVQAQLFVAFAYRIGRGVATDPERAAHWYRQAAEQGLADAQYELGFMYEMGLGLPRDAEEAEYWYGLAVEQGFCPGELSAGGVLSD